MTLSADRAVLALLAQLARSGVRDVVITPGSRNTPITLAAVRPGAPFETFLHLDERSAGYFALGLARQTGRPVAVVCTSGTAAANFLPAAVEARLSRVPVLFLTADRPPELRDIGAPQTIDQVDLYGRHVKWAVDLPVADGDGAVDGAWATAAARAAATATAAPAGPVHLNVPFREPLVGPVGPPPFDAAVATIEPSAPAWRTPAPDAVARVARAAAGRRGLIVCGPESAGLPADAIVDLADALGWPVLADPLSGLRAGRHRLDAIVETYDALVREPAFTALAAPEVVIRFGAAPTSKPLGQWLTSAAVLRQAQDERVSAGERVHADGRAGANSTFSAGGPATFLIDPAGGWRDPDALAGMVIESDVDAFCAALGAALPAGARADPAWRALWSEANGAARAALRAAVDAIDEPFEGRAALALAETLPDGATLVAGNSMPVRDIDSFFPALARRVRIVGTRGASGIDGVVSTAVGAAAARGGPVALMIGDLSLFHDLNGLWPVRRYALDLTVVLVNNGGGGIFHFLPQRELVPEQFEPWFGTPSGIDFGQAIALHGGRHRLIVGRDWTSPLAEALARPGFDVLEVRTERDRNVELHRAVWARVSARVREVVAAAPAASPGAGG